MIYRPHCKQSRHFVDAFDEMRCFWNKEKSADATMPDEPLWVNVDQVDPFVNFTVTSLRVVDWVAG